MKKYIRLIMKKYIRFLLIWALPIALYFAYQYFLGASSSSSHSSGGSVQNIEYTVEKRDFSSSIKLKGKSKMKNEQKMEFNQSEEVTAVNVSVGDTVQKGDVLAMVDTRSADANIKSALINLKNAQDSLNSFVDTAKNVKLKTVNLNIQEKQSAIEEKKYSIDYTISSNERSMEQAKLALTASKNDLEILKKETEKKIASLQRSGKTKDQIIKEKTLALEELKESLEDFKKSYDTKLTKGINEYYAKIEESFISLGSQKNNLETAIEDAQAIIGYKKATTYYAAYYAVNNISSRGAVKEYLIESIDLMEEFSKKYSSIKMERILQKIRNQKDTDELIETVEAARKFYYAWYKTTNAISKWFQDSKESDEHGFSRSKIVEFAQQYAQKATNAQTKITELTELEESLKTTNSSQRIKRDLDRKLSQLEQQVKAAELEIQEIKDNQNYIVDTAGNSISNAQIALNKKINEVKQEEVDIEKLERSQKQEVSRLERDHSRLKVELQELIKERKELVNLSSNLSYKQAQNSLESAEVSYNEAKEKLQDYKLIAPFSGVVTAVEMQVGDRLSSTADSTEKRYITLMDPNAVEITVSIGQADITRVKKWMQAQITFNTYPDKSFSGTVSEVDTIPVEQDGTTKFTAKVVVKKPKDTDMYSGMQANVQIISHNIKDAIVVPFTAVQTDADGKQYVTKLVNGNPVKTEVEAGFTDGKFYEIKKWLAAGDTILEIDYSAMQNSQESSDKKDKEKEEEYPEDIPMDGAMMMY